MNCRQGIIALSVLLQALLSKGIHAAESSPDQEAADIARPDSELAMGTAASIRNQYEEDSRVKDYKLKIPVSVAPPYGTGTWHLYNLAEDPGETNDLAKSHPTILQRLQHAWEKYADEVGVILTE